MSGYEASAPLTGTLLSSKGAAAPSNSVTSLMDDFAVEALAAARPASRPGPSPDDGLSWSPIAAAGSRQDAARGMSRPAPRPKAAVAQERTKLSLRLSVEQHLRLKLAAAHLRLSSQALLMTALDDFLAKTAPDVRDGQCECLMSGAMDHPKRCRGVFCGNAE